MATRTRTGYRPRARGSLTSFPLRRRIRWLKGSPSGMGIRSRPGRFRLLQRGTRETPPGPAMSDGFAAVGLLLAAATWGLLIALLGL